MGVTDLNASLPYWATQGGPAGSGGPPGGAAMPGGQDWLSYLAAMFGPGAAQAAEPNPHGDGPSGPISPNPAPYGGHSTNYGPPNQSAIAASVGYNRPPPVGAGLLDQSGVVRMGGPNGVLNTQPPTGASAPVGAGLPDQSGIARNAAGVLTPGVSPNAPSPAATPVSSPAAPGALAGGPTSANRGAPMGGGPAFTQITAPNSDPLGRNRPQMTALDLSGMFNRGQPQGAPPQTPRVPGPMATGVSQTTGQPMPMSSADIAYGLPDARGAPYPYKLGGILSAGDTPDTLAATRRQAAARLAAASLKQRYG